MLCQGERAGVAPHFILHSCPRPPHRQAHSPLCPRPRFPLLNPLPPFQMYRKTRGPASKTSATRARSLPSALGVHPRFADLVDTKAEASRVSFISKLQASHGTSMGNETH